MSGVCPACKTCFDNLVDHLDAADVRAYVGPSDEGVKSGALGRGTEGYHTLLTPFAVYYYTEEVRNGKTECCATGRKAKTIAAMSKHMEVSHKVRVYNAHVGGLLSHLQSRRPWLKKKSFSDSSG